VQGDGPKKRGRAFIASIRKMMQHQVTTSQETTKKSKKEKKNLKTKKL
jgi:hypothetical protein